MFRVACNTNRFCMYLYHSIVQCTAGPCKILGRFHVGSLEYESMLVSAVRPLPPTRNPCRSHVLIYPFASGRNHVDTQYKFHAGAASSRRIVYGIINIYGCVYMCVCEIVFPCFVHHNI